MLQNTKRVVNLFLEKHTDCSPNSLLLGVLNALKNGRLGAGWSGRVPGRLVSHFLSFVSQFFSFVSQAGCLWSGSRLACLPLPFICLPLLFICFPVLFICLGACGRVPGWLVSHFLSFVSHFFSFVRAGWLVSHVLFLFVSHFFLFVICLPVLFICLPGWVLVVGFPAGLSPTSFICLPGWALVVGFAAGLSPFVSHACGRVPGWLVSHFLSFVSHFFSLSPRLSASGRVRTLFRWPSGVRPFPLMSALFRWPCSISIRLSPRSLTAGVRPFPLAM